MKYRAEIREVENGFVTEDNFDGEHIWKDAKSAFAHIQKCYGEMSQ